MLAEALVHAEQAPRRAPEDAQALAILVEHPQRALRGFPRLPGGLDDAVEKEFEPFTPGALGPGALQQVVVPVAVLLEEEAQVEQRLGQDALGAEEKRDEEPAHAPVAIQEGVDGLELDVR
jgi:hypothetical protein